VKVSAFVLFSVQSRSLFTPHHHHFQLFQGFGLGNEALLLSLPRKLVDGYEKAHNKWPWSSWIASCLKGVRSVTLIAAAKLIAYLSRSCFQQPALSLLHTTSHQVGWALGISVYEEDRW
jgi:hypothetical protein